MQTTNKMGGLREMFSGNRGLVFGMSALFGTITGIVAEWQLYTDASGRVAQAHQQLNQLVAQGRTGTTQYSQALQAAAKDQRFLDFSTRNLALAFTNLIPDLILIINGIINLSSKAQGLTALTNAATAMNTLTTSMSGASTAATTLSTSFVAVAGSATDLGVGTAAAVTGMEEIGLAESNAVRTSEGLIASNQGLVASENEVAVATERVTAAMTEAAIAEGNLSRVNAVTGASFNSLTGAEARAAAGASGAGGAGGAAGGIRGAIGGLLSRLGLAGTAGLAGAIGGGGTALVTLFYEFVLKPGAEATSQRILEEGKKLDAANKTIASSTDELVSKVQSGTASMADYWSLLQVSVANEGAKIIATQQQVAAGQPVGPPPGAPTGPTAPGQPLVRKGFDPKTMKARTWEEMQIAEGGGNAPALAGTQLGGVAKTVAGGTVVPGQGGVTSQFTTAGQTAQADATRNLYLGPAGVEAERLLKQKEAANEAAKAKAALAVPTPQELFGQMERKTAEQTLMANLQKKVTTPAGTFGLAGDISRKQFTELQGLGAQALELSKPVAGEDTQAAMARGEKFAATMQKIKDITTDTTTADKAYEEEQRKLQEAQDATGKTVESVEQAMHKHNEQVLAMPTALAQATGAQLEFSRAEQTAMGIAVVRDKELDAHIALMAQQSAAYTSVNAVQGQSLKVQEEIVNIGNKVVGGVEEELTHVQALNIFWGNLSTTMQENIQTNQQQTLAAIDVTQALTNQTEQQFLVNEGMIAGKEAAQQYVEQTIAGVAQNQQYVASMTETAQLMGVTLPTGIKLTAKELDAVVLKMRETGNSSLALRDVLQNAFKPATEAFGKLVSAGVEGSKEFGKAWKDMDLSLPKGLSGAVKDFGKDMADVQEKINGVSANINVVFGAMQSGFQLTESQASKFGDSLSKQFDKIGQMNPALQQVFGPIQIFLDNLGKGEHVAGVTKVMELWQSLQTIFADGLQTGDIEAGMKAVNDILGEQITVVTKAEGAWKKFFNSVKDQAAGAEQFKKGISGMLDFEKDFGKIESKAIKKGEDIPDLPGAVKGKVTRGPIAPQAEKPPDIRVRTGVTGTTDAQIEAAGGFNAAEGKVPKGEDKTGTQKIVSEVQSMQAAIAKVLPQIVATVNATGAGIIKAFATTFAHVMDLTGTFIKAVAGAFTALSTVGRTAINQMGTGMLQAFTKTFSSVMEMTGTFIKAMAGAFTSLSTVGKTAFNAMGTEIIKAFTKTYETVMEMTGTFIKAEDVAFESLSTAVIQSIATMSKGVQTEISNMYTFVTDVTNKMNEDVVAAIEDMNTKGSKAAASFASAMESSMGKVETAANNAMTAVSNLADEVGQLDGMSATVTVTTNFKTTGTPPKQTGDVTINRQMGAVIAAASAKSFQYGGSIETSHGPQMAIFGDNPGGEETVAFIPHDNPFPTLRKLAKLFKGTSSTSDVDVKEGGGDYVFNLEVHTHNIMDSREIGVTVTRQTFRKLRTRMG